MFLTCATHVFLLKQTQKILPCASIPCAWYVFTYPFYFILSSLRQLLLAPGNLFFYYFILFSSSRSSPCAMDSLRLVFPCARKSFFLFLYFFTSFLALSSFLALGYFVLYFLLFYFLILFPCASLLAPGNRSVISFIFFLFFSPSLRHSHAYTYCALHKNSSIAIFEFLSKIAFVFLL